MVNFETVDLKIECYIKSVNPSLNSRNFWCELLAYASDGSGPGCGDYRTAHRQHVLCSQISRGWDIRIFMVATETRSYNNHEQEHLPRVIQ